jgi:uridine monophosphate synthetase
LGFFKNLETRVAKIDSLLCVGLDPHPDELAESNPQAAEMFCLRLIEATAGYAAAFKPNAAFFEAFGPQGIAALQRVIAAIPAGIPVILDAKRGDIASTAQAYARAAFQTLGAQAITINPYLGRDAVAPFITDPERAAFMLCKTSNPGASDLQDLPIRSDPLESSWRLYEQVAQLGKEWNQRDNLGLVVGATQPEALARVRAIAPQIWILAPGVGAQGGNLQSALQAGLRADGLGMLISVSRGISQADHPEQAALQLRDAINQIRSQIRTQPVPGEQDTFPTALADGLLQAGCVKFGQFRLKSGLVSPIYIDLRRLAGYPALLHQAAAAYLPLLRRLAFDRLAGLPYAALPIATAISLQANRPMIYPRKEAKAYGTQVEIEGVFSSGEKVVVIDDLATTGGSKFEAINKLSEAGLLVQDVVVLIDRQSGAVEALAQAGYRLHAVFRLTELLEYWEKTGQVPADQVAAARTFIAGTTGQ